MKNFITSPRPRGSARQAILLGTLLAVSAGAQAAGTLSGTDITNLAKLSYSVSGTPQQEICSSETGNSQGNGGTSGTTCTHGTNGASNTTFKVDNKVDVLVAEQSGAATIVAAGQIVAETTFLVTNEGNTTQDFALTVGHRPNGTVLFGSTDSFDATGCTVYNVEWVSGSVGLHIAGNQHINALGPDSVVRITVRCSIPHGVVTNDASVIYLGATARADDSNDNTVGAALTQSSSNGQNTVEIVFADDAGSDDTAITSDLDGLRDATHSARDAYVVSTSALTVTKTMSTVCDPLNGSSTPFNIPGALVRWSITVSNAASAGASATLTQIVDALNANTAFNNDFGLGADAATCSEANDVPANGSGKGFRVSCVANVGGARACHSTPQFFTTANDNDAVDLDAGSVDVNFALALPVEAGHGAGELKPGESVTVQFQVYIN